MYQYLLIFHSIFRWFVLCSLMLSIYKAYLGYTQHKEFSKTDNALRHWTATITHIQLIVGITLYFKSPLISYFWGNLSEAISYFESSFFGLFHLLFMLMSIVIVTIGSALAKRKTTAREKYRTVLIWFSVALFIIFVAIPWPFSPFVNRPYIRTF